jgi:hypothetical protein
MTYAMRLPACLFVCAVIVGCGGSGPDGPGFPVISFSSSACKKEAAAKMAAVRAFDRIVLDDETGLDGLRCVAWKRVGSSGIKLDLFNFDGACGATWSGAAAVAADGTLELRIDNPSCVVMKCGSCLYDWSFDVASVPADKPTSLVIAVNACSTTQAAVTTTVTLGAEAQGIVCGFAYYGALQAEAVDLGTCGQVGMPCTGAYMCGTGSPSTTGTCAAGLTCGDDGLSASELVCLVPCTTTADCPRTDVWSCQSGQCRPANPF